MTATTSAIDTASSIRYWLLFPTTLIYLATDTLMSLLSTPTLSRILLLWYWVSQKLPPLVPIFTPTKNTNATFDTIYSATNTPLCPRLSPLQHIITRLRTEYRYIPTLRNKDSKNYLPPPHVIYQITRCLDWMESVLYKGWGLISLI